MESEWALPENAEMPNKGIRQVIFHHFEEILLASIGPSNIAILRKEPDPEFTDYLKGLGLELPTILEAGESSAKPWLPTSQLVIQNPSLIRFLSKQVSEGKVAVLESFGVSGIIEQIANLSGLSLPSAGTKVSKFISRKSFSQTISKKLGIHVPDGEICSSAKEILEAIKLVRFRNKGCSVVIKPDLGAAGKGQLIINRTQDVDRINDMISKEYLEAHGPAFTVERWFSKSLTLAYEIEINQYEYEPESIILRQALKDSENRDYGYVYPADVKDKVLKNVQEAARILAAELRVKHQYHGPVRCDALLLPDGCLFPILELNARHSFFYFIDLLHARLAPESIGLFCWFFFRSPGHLRFGEFMKKTIGNDLMFHLDKQEGVIVPIWSTVTATENIKAEKAEPPLRRLFALILARTLDTARSMADKLRKNLRSDS